MDKMYYSDYKKYDVLNGSGIRHSLFVSGCTHHCKGCFNKKTWNFKYGKPFTEKIQNQIIEDLKPGFISGLSILGGEPFDNSKYLIPFVKKYKTEIKKDLWIWTGYTFEELVIDPVKLELLKFVDVLVDGKFIEKQKDLTLKFRGSKNQRIINVKKSLKNNRVIPYLP